MKTKKVILYTLMFLPLLITLIALPFLPDQIPAHYGFDNQVTRWGSKYETLILPVMTIFMGYFFLATIKTAAKQENSGKNNEKIGIVAGICSLITFNAMTYYFLYTDFNRVENLSSVSTNLYQLLFILLGVFMVVIGNVMPKLRMNSMLGLRTPWSLKNEITWKKSQRFGGISFIIAGIVIIMISLFTDNLQCFIWSIVIVTLVVIIDAIYSFRISLNY